MKGRPEWNVIERPYDIGIQVKSRQISEGYVHIESDCGDNQIVGISYTFRNTVHGFDPRLS